MGKAIAVMLAILLGTHGFLGLFVEGTHLLIFNVDIVLDVVYLGCAAVLAFIGMADPQAAVVRAGLILVGGLLILLGVVGLVDDHLGDAAPTGLTLMDFVVFFGVGASALYGAVQPHITRRIYDSDPVLPARG